MKTAAILFCLMPWMTTALVSWLMHGSPHPPIDGILGLAGFLWLTISPAVTGVGILVAYQEGKRCPK